MQPCTEILEFHCSVRVREIHDGHLEEPSPGVVTGRWVDNDGPLAATDDETVEGACAPLAPPSR